MERAFVFFCDALLRADDLREGAAQRRHRLGREIVVVDVERLQVLQPIAMRQQRLRSRVRHRAHRQVERLEPRGTTSLRLALDTLAESMSRRMITVIMSDLLDAGEGAVERHGRRVPPYAETQAYVQQVLGAYQGLRDWAAAP